MGTIKMGQKVFYLDENDRVVESEVNESNRNWILKNLGQRVFTSKDVANSKSGNLIKEKKA